MTDTGNHVTLRIHLMCSVPMFDTLFSIRHYQLLPPQNLAQTIQPVPYKLSLPQGQIYFTENLHSHLS